MRRDERVVWIRDEFTVVRNLTDNSALVQGVMFDVDALWLKHVHPEDRQRVLEEYEAFLAGGPDVGDYRMVRSDGKIIWIRDRARLFTDEGGALIETRGDTGCLRDQRGGSRDHSRGGAPQEG